MAWIRRETENGTVQYICSNCYDYHEFRKDFGEHTFNENFIFCRRCGARNGTGVPPAITPPNEPLTCDGCISLGTSYGPCMNCIRSRLRGDMYRRPPEGGRKPDE